MYFNIKKNYATLCNCNKNAKNIQKKKNYKILSGTTNLCVGQLAFIHSVVFV